MGCYPYHIFFTRKPVGPEPFMFSDSIYGVYGATGPTCLFISIRDHGQCISLIIEHNYGRTKL